MKRLILLAIFLCSGFTIVGAQLEAYEKPFVASKLAVRLVDPNDEPVVGGQVQLMSTGWKRSLKSGTTNSNGYFEFKIERTGEYYLRFSALAFRQYHVKIYLKPSKRKMVKFRMDLAI